MQLIHPSPAPQPFSSKSNILLTARSFKVHFKLPVIKKAAPTVSVTNANAARLNTVDSRPSQPTLPEISPASSIPFPSSPIPCPSRKRADSEAGYDARDGRGEEAESAEVEGTKGSPLPFHRRISHIDILRRRSKSCLAASYFHSDSYLARTSQPSDALASPAPEGQRPGKKRPAARRESMSAGSPTGKTVRKAKRHVADAQFLASMHSSIAMRVRTRMDGGGGSRGDDCAAQDAMLAERIWHTLVDMGYKPVPLEDAPLPPPLSPSPSLSSPGPAPAPAEADSARDAAERAARRTMAISSTPFMLDRVEDLPPAPTGVLAAPQLVATLIMRHRERSATRPRSAAKKRAITDEPLPASPKPSPLSATFLPTSTLTSNCALQQ